MEVEKENIRIRFFLLYQISKMKNSKITKIVINICQINIFQ